jgi:hypothetical protein
MPVALLAQSGATGKEIIEFMDTIDTFSPHK